MSGWETEIPMGFVLRKYKYDGLWNYEIELSGGRGCFSGITIEQALESLFNHNVWKELRPQKER